MEIYIKPSASGYALILFWIIDISCFNIQTGYLIARNSRIRWQYQCISNAFPK